jgi:superfamily I DNA/RNA helicase
LHWRRCFDWEDVPLNVCDAIDTGFLDGARYEAILVDEAQDFAPTWFAVLRRLLNPETGVMFMAADGVQRIYRNHSWRSMGLNVVGRTRILPRPYRMTYEIACAAAELVRGNPAVIEALNNDEEELPPVKLDDRWMRHGDYPELRLLGTKAQEMSWLHNRLKELRGKGYEPQDIAIFHRKGEAVEEYAGYLRQHYWPVRVLKNDAPVGEAGITVGTMHAAKGLEFRAVFVPHLEALYSELGHTTEERRESVLNETRLLYVVMTRARERVYLMHQGRLPDQLSHLARYLDGVRG